MIILQILIFLHPSLVGYHPPHPPPPHPIFFGGGTGGGGENAEKRGGGGGGEGIGSVKNHSEDIFVLYITEGRKCLKSTKILCLVHDYAPNLRRDESSLVAKFEIKRL